MGIETIATILSDYSILISFLAGLLTGEEVIIILSFLSANGVLKVWQLFLFSGIGVFLSDIIIYFVGSTKFIRRIMRRGLIARPYRRFERAVEKISREKIFLLLLATKFIYGTRILTLLYLGIKKIPHRKFIIYDCIVVFTYLIPVIGLGWVAGSGFRLAITIFKSVQIGLLVIVVGVIVFIIIKEWTNIELLEELRKLDQINPFSKNFLNLSTPEKNIKIRKLTVNPGRKEDIPIP
jgi:membrane protein DedA with SNARE-associated domain